ncbi:MAG TPA: hypothetical protein VHC47_01295 [Mucilaginibacter sp.]|nr:hypothetical protein [Mucilaginibacter sp.]
MHRPKKQAALGFIFATLLIDIMGLANVILVFPKLIPENNPEHDNRMNLKKICKHHV